MAKPVIKGDGLFAIIKNTSENAVPLNKGTVTASSVEEQKNASSELDEIKEKIGKEELELAGLTEKVKELRVVLNEEMPEGIDRENILLALKERARSFDDAENLLDAFHLYRRILRIDSADIEALYNLASIYYSADLEEKSAECLEAILDIDPSEARAGEWLDGMSEGEE